MGRTPLRRALFPVLDFLRKRGSATKMEIVRGTGLSWEVVTKVLEVLEELGMVEKEEKGREKIFRMKKGSGFDSEAYFFVSLPDRDKEQIERLFGTIKETWRKVTGREPSPVHVQKAAVKIIRELGLPLPVGRYRYGYITPLRYIPSKEYPELRGDIAKEAEKIVEALAKKYSREKPWKIVEDHHQEEDLHLYDTIARMQTTRDRKELLRAVERLLVEVKSKKSEEMLSRLYGVIYSFYDPDNSMIGELVRIVIDYVLTAEYYHDLLERVEAWRMPWLRMSLEDKEKDIEEILSYILPPVEVDQDVDKLLTELEK